VFGAFLEVTGLLPSAHYHVLAHINEQVFEKAMGCWMINGEAAGMADVGMANWAFHKARQLCHLEPPPSAAAFSAPSPPIAPASGSQITANGSALNLSTIKVGMVMDQRFGEEITYLPNAEIQKMRARFIDAYDEPPSADIACNKEQLACLQHALINGREPYVDMAVWGPHGTRLLKKASMSGLNIMRDGTFMTVELFGPPNIELWCGCYDVLSTGCIMLGAVRRPYLAAYRKWIIKLASIYGPVVWHLLYQTDVRCRSELMQEVFQILLAEHNAAKMSKMPTDFDPIKPWDAVWKRVLEMKDWWVDEFERPAGLINSKVMGIGAVIGGDVQIATSYQRPSAPHQQPAQINGGGKGRERASKRKRGKGGNPNTKGQHQTSQGNGSPAAASDLHCKICKATDHEFTQCNRYDPNHGKNGKGGKKGKGGKNTKGGKNW